MDSYIGWFVVAFGLLVAELLTGTFYLLVISIALAVAGIAALAGAPFALQFVVAAAIGIGGSIWLRSTRFGKRLHERGDDRVQNMDIGQSLRVDNWTAGTHGARQLPRRRLGRRACAGRAADQRRIRHP